MIIISVTSLEAASDDTHGQCEQHVRVYQEMANMEFKEQMISLKLRPPIQYFTTQLRQAKLPVFQP